MSDPFSKVAPGQRMAALPAAAWNAFLEAAAANRNRLGNKTSQALPTYNDGQIIQVKNDTEVDLERFNVLGLTTPIFPPDDDAPATFSQIAFKGIAPTLAAHGGGRIAITMAPLAAGAIGPAVIDGFCFCKLTGVSDVTNAKTAEVSDDVTATLALSQGTGVQVMWVEESVETDRWALVRLGGGGGGDTAQMLKITSIATNVLTCHSWDGETEGETDIYVAMPTLLQQTLGNYPQLTSLTSVNAQEVNVEASAEEATWKITQPYVAGQIIWAAPRFTGLNVGLATVRLMDTNVNGRVWAEVQEA